jgi:hypothetical protein
LSVPSGRAAWRVRRRRCHRVQRAGRLGLQRVVCSHRVRALHRGAAVLISPVYPGQVARRQRPPFSADLVRPEGTHAVRESAGSCGSLPWAAGCPVLAYAGILALCDPSDDTRDCNGKEGVDGSSPSEGSRKGPGNGAFFFARARGRWRVGAIWAAFGPHTNRKRVCIANRYAIQAC